MANFRRRPRFSAPMLVVIVTVATVAVTTEVFSRGSDLPVPAGIHIGAGVASTTTSGSGRYPESPAGRSHGGATAQASGAAAISASNPGPAVPVQTILGPTGALHGTFTTPTDPGGSAGAGSPGASSGGGSSGGGQPPGSDPPTTVTATTVPVSTPTTPPTTTAKKGDGSGDDGDGDGSGDDGSHGGSTSTTISTVPPSYPVVTSPSTTVPRRDS